MAEHKILGIILAVGLCVVAGIFWVLDDEKATAVDAEGETVAVAPPEATPGEQPAKPEITGEPLDEAFAGKVLVSKQPVQVLAEPSASASAMFGFPAGRPFRAISQKDGFIRIQDVRSGASGWIEKAALAPAPTKPVATSPSSSRRSASSAKPSEKKPEAETAAAEPEPAPRKRRGLFGGGGLFGGLFGGR